MKVSQWFFTEHNTGQRCNPRFETMQGRKCVILKVSSGSEAAWEKFLKIVCKWRSLRSENTPKNIGIILKALNFKNFRIYWELQIFWKLSHPYRKFDIYHESPLYWLPWVRTISPCGRRVWGFTTFSPILSTLSFCKLSPYTQAVNFTNFILYWVSYLLHFSFFQNFPQWWEPRISEH